MSGYFISEEKNLLDLNIIHQFISQSYWGKGRTLEEVKKTIDNSYCFGIYTTSNNQIGFARMVTDYIYFGHLMDVFISGQYQGNGYGEILIEHILKNPIIKNLKSITLKTKDAHTLYEKFGFDKIGASSLWMSVDKQKLL